MSVFIEKTDVRHVKNRNIKIPHKNVWSFRTRSRVRTFHCKFTMVVILQDNRSLDFRF